MVCMVFVMAAMAELAIVILLDRISIPKIVWKKISSESNKKGVKMKQRNPFQQLLMKFCSRNIVDRIDFLAFWIYFVAFSIFSRMYSQQYKPI